MKKLIALLLIVFVYSGDDDVYDPVRIANAITSLQDQYPEGTPWTNDDVYVWEYDVASGLGFGKYTGRGCVAFAMRASDAAFGNVPAYKKFDRDNIRVGDIIRVYDNTHSVIVLEDLGNNKYRVAEGNFNHSVHYGRVINLEESGFDYRFTRYPEQ